MKVLVAHATKRGSTAEIAEAVADALRASGLEADCIETARSRTWSPTTPSRWAAPST